MSPEEALEIVRTCIDPSKSILIDEAWQTLFNKVHAQQSNNSAMDAIAEVLAEDSLKRMDIEHSYSP
jgi:hypothetical protein